MGRIITGNIIGIPNPVSDWNQTNPNKADYIKNKPDFDGLANDVEELAQKLGDIDVSDQIAEAIDGLATEEYVDDKIANIPTPDVSGQISEHNTSSDAHNDVRLLIKDLSEKLNAFFDSDDETLDELSEIVEYIKSNKELIESVTTSKVSVSDIVDDLTTDVSTKPLSASQGVVLKNLVDALNSSKLNVADLQNAIDDALTQAKDNGEFDGKDGDPGKSAYEYARESGYTGTEKEFSDSLADINAAIQKTQVQIITWESDD